VTPDDIKKIAEPILSHRLILAPGARLQNLDEDSILKEILNNVPVPGSDIKPI
jgi:MoxR-like ATPase